MDCFRNRRIKHVLGNSKGELLIESVISFLILIIIIVGVTVVVQTATKMNVKADENSIKMEEAINNIEVGKTSGTTQAGVFEITISGEKFTKNIAISQEGDLVYFVPK